MKKIAIGSDHGGFELKQHIKDYLIKKGYSVIDEGTNSTESADYPIFGKKVAHDVADKKTDFGIVICTSGIGISIAANKVHGIRAALVHNVDLAHSAREHNNANVLALAGGSLNHQLALEIVDTFLSVEFSSEERHVRRVQEIEED